ncbi:MAG: peptide chain release factor 2 [Dehalococcoidia bacterium]|nr:peptide chain release factor 2 [Dehalococcoidia bacterium]TEU03616.1 MAG: peptide chain release factor 2 [Dehalococcoidia bacterium]
MVKIEAESSRPDFWQDQERAQGVMRQLGELKGEVEKWRIMERRVSELLELADLVAAGEEPALEAEIAAEAERVAAQFEEIEFELLLSGEYEKRNAFLAVHAGAGGTEAQDWAEMLLRMYLRWAERRGYQAGVIEVSPGEEAGIKSALIQVIGDYAYGYLKAERGVHRLVRLSPFDASHGRHTSFALVEVLPEAERELDVRINPDEVRIDFFRASGPGGQHVQKTSSAVRVTHLPTGLVAICQNERSQYQNKELALKVLGARLLELELEKRAEEKARLKGEHVVAGWGNQIRSYVLHPYKMVKDHRTGYETSDPIAVLDGALDELIEAYLKFTIGKGS